MDKAQMERLINALTLRVDRNPYLSEGFASEVLDQFKSGEISAEETIDTLIDAINHVDQESEEDDYDYGCQ